MPSLVDILDSTTEDLNQASMIIDDNPEVDYEPFRGKINELQTAASELLSQVEHVGDDEESE